MINFHNIICVYSENAAETKAAGIFSDEIKLRTGTETVAVSEKNKADIIFRTDKISANKDIYSITEDEDALVFSAKSLRGLIFSIGLFLRKAVVKDGRISLTEDITGAYIPQKKIRGHQLGYRPLNNTYESWDTAQYRRYYLDLMYFGTNTVEQTISSDPTRRSELMKYGEYEMTALASAIAKELDLDISLWYPNNEKDFETAIKNREYVFSNTPALTQLFVPGGDPGDLEPEEFFRRLEKITEILKKYHPDAEVWPSAQAPHSIENWGENFIEQLKGSTHFVDGLITGPNRAFDIDTLRRKTPSHYNIRFYPDITHNVRCEHPVHFERDDWHYALAATQSRECPNPRPQEYRLLHRLISPYVIGSVSYSEGVNDDVNKAVWGALDFDECTPLTDILRDYARLYMPGIDEKKVADGIFALEKNWEGTPDENPGIENTYALWQGLLKETPSLEKNWRFVLCLFRSECDVFVRRKMIFENGLIKAASKQIRKGNITTAEDILNTPYDEGITSVREKITEHAFLLFSLIGIQMGTKELHADGWERGAVLDTIDQPITDRLWLLDRITKAKTTEEPVLFMNKILDRNKVDGDEYYYSLTLDGFIPLGVTQTPDFYMDFRGDNPKDNCGKSPVCIQKLFDHFEFRAKVGGLCAAKDYKLTVTYKNSPADSDKHKVTVNGVTIYEGKQFGGTRETEFEEMFLPEGFAAVSYNIPEKVLENGCAYIEITEPSKGFEIAEFRITKQEA